MAALLLVANLVIFGVWLMRRKEHVHTSKTTSIMNLTSIAENVTASSTVIGSVLNTTNFTVDSNQQTLWSQHELSVPSYLQCAYAVDYIVGEQINKGGQGSICKAEVVGPLLGRRTRNKPIVVKMSNLPLQMLSERLKIAFYQELSLHWRFRDHPGFARIFGFSEEPFATLIMQYYPLGSLRKLIYGTNTELLKYKYSRRQVQTLLKQCASAYAYMHANSFSHSDIKPDNVLLQLNIDTGLVEPVITDFGIAHVTDDMNLQVKAFETSELNGVSLSYGAPEAFLRYRNKVKETPAHVWYMGDVFSFAMMLKEVMTRAPVWLK